MDRRIEEILQLASRRRLPGTAPPIAADLQRIARRTQAEGRRMGAVAAAWCDLLPALLLVRCRIASLRSGTLSVRVDSSSTLFELDRFMREGAEARLRTATLGAVQRVRLRVGPLEEDPALESRPACDEESE